MNYLNGLANAALGGALVVPSQGPYRQQALGPGQFRTYTELLVALNKLRYGHSVAGPSIERYGCNYCGSLMEWRSVDPGPRKCHSCGAPRGLK